MTLRGYKNISQLATLKGVAKKDGRKLVPGDLSLVTNAAIVFDEYIRWVGESHKIPAEYQKISWEDKTGFIITPELVDSHTHLVFAGDRAAEYTQRLNGVDYQAIAKAGGGILHTMKHTQQSSEEELLALARERIQRINSYGVGTIEIKSGYDLSFEGEYKLSRIIKKLKEEFAPRIQIFNTYMAAHAVPDKYNSSSDYMKDVVLPLLDKLAKEEIIDAVDIFHEKGYFNTEDVESLFFRAQELEIPTKIHADEFNDNNGAAVACNFQSLSADHLLKTSDQNIRTLANSDTIATLLPGTSLFLGKPSAEARTFLDAGVKVAIASDYNPGSCHCDNLLLLAAIAAPLYQLNSAELWAAITHNAAHSLGLTDQGALIINKKARFSQFQCSSIDHITYSWGRNFSH